MDRPVGSITIRMFTNILVSIIICRGLYLECLFVSCLDLIERSFDEFPKLVPLASSILKQIERQLHCDKSLNSSLQNTRPILTKMVRRRELFETTTNIINKL